MGPRKLDLRATGQVVKFDGFLTLYQEGKDDEGTGGEDYSTGEITGVEALLRWRHPELGVLPPAAFIELAEHTGAQSQVAWWVFGEVIRQAGGVARRSGVLAARGSGWTPRVITSSTYKYGGNSGSFAWILSSA